MFHVLERHGAGWRKGIEEPSGRANRVPSDSLCLAFLDGATI
jgi:hypothetical protein